jgi:peptidoglycan/LPS O-acetylase OafA/YrhL
MATQSGTARISATHTNSAQPGVRFETLDSWRGICALLVAMMHFPASGAIAESAFVRSAYLFVDYFFVLSGFVIAHGYSQKLTDGASYARFLVLRIGRIYPLHIAVLLLFVGFELSRLAIPALRGNGPMPFTEGNSFGALVSNIFLLNGMGINDKLTWNGPSWSISAEMWTYVLFGAGVLLLRRRLWIALVAAIIICPVILYLYAPRYMDATYDFGFIRCVYGFSLGVLLYDFSKRRLAPAMAYDGRALLIWTLVELTAVAAVIVFVSTAAHSSLSFAAPLLFAVALSIFIRERGLVSSLLRTKLSVWLGSLSYGIYMLHIFVQSRMINAGTVLSKVAGFEIVGPFQINGEAFDGFGLHGPWFGTLAMLVMLVAVVAAAWIGYVLVEVPFQRLSRRLVQAAPRRQPSRAEERLARIAGRRPGVAPTAGGLG